MCIQYIIQAVYYTIGPKVFCEFEWPTNSNRNQSSGRKNKSLDFSLLC